MLYKFKNSDEFVKAVKTNIGLQNELKADPAGTLEKVTIEIPNTKVYQMVVASLIITVLVIVTGLIIIVLTDKTANNQNVLSIFTALASTAVGALAGVLMPVQKQS